MAAYAVNETAAGAGAVPLVAAYAQHLTPANRRKSRPHPAGVVWIAEPCGSCICDPEAADMPCVDSRR